MLEVLKILATFAGTGLAAWAGLWTALRSAKEQSRLAQEREDRKEKVERHRRRISTLVDLSYNIVRFQGLAIEANAARIHHKELVSIRPMPFTPESQHRQWAEDLTRTAERCLVANRNRDEAIAAVLRPAEEYGLAPDGAGSGVKVLGPFVQQFANVVRGYSASDKDLTVLIGAETSEMIHLVRFLRLKEESVLAVMNGGDVAAYESMRHSTPKARWYTDLVKLSTQEPVVTIDSGLVQNLTGSNVEGSAPAVETVEQGVGATERHGG